MRARSEADVRFAYNRYPDARAGSLQSAPSDFEASLRGTGHFKVEVKEVKITAASTRRVPEKNFSADKIARMWKWELAGDECWVVVCHRIEGRGGVQEWRLVPLRHFREKAASWDVAAFPFHTSVDAVMLQLFGTISR
jgi:hypothetical protein